MSHRRQTPSCFEFLSKIILLRLFNVFFFTFVIETIQVRCVQSHKYPSPHKRRGPSLRIQMRFFSFFLAVGDKAEKCRISISRDMKLPTGVVKIFGVSEICPA